MAIDRRDLVQLVGAAGVAASGTLSAQHEHRTPATPVGPYEPRVLSAPQYATLGRMLEVLLPADASSVSARDAGVAMYLDTTLKHGDDRMRGAWLSGLDAVDRAAKAQYGAVFLKLSNADAVQFLTTLAGAEDRPESAAEKFFVLFKQASLNAYYLSDAGRRSLGYRGDTAIRDFPGCTHRGSHQQV